MQIVPMTGPTARSGPGRRWRVFTMLFASLLVLGFLQPVSASSPATLRVKDRTVVETNHSSTAYVRIVLSGTSRRASVSFTTLDGSAKAGQDYQAHSGRVVFPAGTHVVRVPVQIFGDRLNEADEYFKVRIFDAAGATIADRVAFVRIVNDDPLPTLSASDVSVTEPDSGSATMTFPVTLSAPSGRNVRVSYTVSAGTATQGTDWSIGSPTGVLTFPAGTTTGSVSLSVLGDTLDEPDETVNLTLSNPVHAAIADGSAVGTIVDNDVTATLSIGDQHATEGQDMVFTIRLSQAITRDVTVRWMTSNGTAVAPGDYTAAHGTATIPAGHLVDQVTVKTVNDTTDEPNETFSVDLSAPVNATIADGHAVGLIVDNDVTATLSIGDQHATEGQDEVFTVRLSSASPRNVSVSWATSDGTAVAPGDYTAAHGTVTIPAGHLVEQVTVKTVDDTRDEADETFFVNLSSPVNATIADGHAVGLIVDNDAGPTLSINDVTITAEGYHAVLTVRLSAASSSTVTVNWATANGTAVAPGDYTADHGTLTFAPGDTTKTVTVATVDDTVHEGAETFNVVLSAPSNATLLDATGVVTIPASD